MHPTLARGPRTSPLLAGEHELPPPAPAGEPRAARAAAVLVAAGASTRFGRPGEARKPLRRLGDRLLVEHSAGALGRATRVEEIVLVAHAEDLAELERLARTSPHLAKVRAVVAGGKERADSVRLGAERARGDLPVLCIHDAARPLVSPAAIDRAIELAFERGAALVAAPLADSLHRADSLQRAGAGPSGEGSAANADEGAFAVESVPRAGLWLAQTPQCFRAGEYLRVLARAAAERRGATDDAALWQHYVGPLAIVPGDPSFLKVTTAADLELAEALLARRAARENPT